MIAFSIFLYFLISVFTIFIVVYYYIRLKRHTYWKRKNINFEEPTFPLGNLKEVGKTQSYGEAVKKIYDSHRGEKVVGMYFLFGAPILLVKDLDIIQTILIKNFSSFTDRGFIQAEKYDPLTGNLFFLDGKKWKHLRIKLTPTFTSGKMKMMFPLILKCGKDLISYLEKAQEDKNDVDSKDILSRLTTDVIASCAFGIEISSFKNPDSEFRHVADCFFKPSFIQRLKIMFCYVWPKLLAFLHVKLIPANATNFFVRSVKDVIEHREKYNIKRNDFIQLLMELIKEGKIESSGYVSEEIDCDPTFTFEQAAAQAFIFFIAGFETSSTVLMFSLFELATNQNIQDQLRGEIDQVTAKQNAEITYDGIQEMKYLDRVISETLRKYPPAPNLMRSSCKSHYFPEIDMTVNSGTHIYISVLGLHKDPEYYPDPEKFDPDRFLPENKQKRHPMCYLPFGDGPRNCIGKRFGLMVTKTALAMILSNFKVVLSEKTKIPLEFDKKAPLTDVKGTVYFKMLKR